MSGAEATLEADVEFFRLLRVGWIQGPDELFQSSLKLMKIQHLNTQKLLANTDCPNPYSN